jgi:hypothetical protein
MNRKKKGFFLEQPGLEGFEWPPDALAQKSGPFISQTSFLLSPVYFNSVSLYEIQSDPEVHSFCLNTSWEFEALPDLPLPSSQAYA